MEIPMHGASSSAVNNSGASSVEPIATHDPYEQQWAGDDVANMDEDVSTVKKENLLDADEEIVYNNLTKQQQKLIKLSIEHQRLVHGDGWQYKTFEEIPKRVEAFYKLGEQLPMHKIKAIIFLDPEKLIT